MRKIISVNLITCIIIYVVFQNFSFYEVRGDSMTGVLDDGESVLTINPNNWISKVKRKSIIIFNHIKRGQKLMMIKEVVGVPGDTCYVYTLFNKHKKFLFINENIENVYFNSNEAMKYFLDLQNYTYTKEDYITESYVLNDQYFVIGRDSIGSIDSRHFGPIDAASVTGKVLKIFHQ